MVNVNGKWLSDALPTTHPHAFYCAVCGRPMYDHNEIDERACIYCSTWADRIESDYARPRPSLPALVQACNVMAQRSKLARQIQKDLAGPAKRPLPLDPFEGFRR